MILILSLLRLIAGTMVIKWKERQHERDEMNTLRNAASVAMLQDYGLLKFFHMSNMRTQLPLLTHIIEWWDPEEGSFHVGDHSL